MLAFTNMFFSNLKIQFRNKQALVWTFILPVVLMILFGMAFGRSETLVLKIGIIDEAKNDFSKEFIQGLEKNSAFKITKDSRNKELKYLEDGERSVVIVLPKNFGSSVTELIEAKKKSEAAGQRDPAGAGARAFKMPEVKPSEIQVYFDTTNPSLFGTSKSMLNQIVLSMNHKATGSPDLFKIIERQVSARKYSNIDFFAAGILSMFTMNGGTIAVVMIIVGYREQGILRRLQVTPLSIASFMGTSIIVRVLISIMQMGLILAIAIFIFGAQVAGSPWLLMALVVEGSLVFISLGFAIASFSGSNQTAQAVANIITMPMMFLSGVFFPTDTFPKFIQPLIKVLPLTYLARGLRDVMMRGAGLDMVAKDMGILALFGLGFFLVSVRFFKWE